MDSEYVGKIKRLAFTDDVYMGMKQVYEAFPNLVEGPGAVLLRMGGLSHFSLVLMEDSGDFDDGESEFEEFDFDAEGPPTPDGDEDEEDADVENDEEIQDMEELDIEDLDDHEDASNAGPFSDPDDLPEEGDLEDLEGEEAWLSHQEREAMERMSKGYFRHVGDIHFESALHSPDYWDSWYPYFQQVEVDFAEQQTEVPEWKQPLVSIVEIKYGLNYIGLPPAIDWKQPGAGDSSDEEDSSDGS